MQTNEPRSDTPQEQGLNTDTPTQDEARAEPHSDATLDDTVSDVTSLVLPTETSGQATVHALDQFQGPTEDGEPSLSDTVQSSMPGQDTLSDDSASAFPSVSSDDEPSNLPQGLDKQTAEPAITTVAVQLPSKPVPSRPVCSTSVLGSPSSVRQAFPRLTTYRQESRHFVDDGRLVPPASKGLEHDPSYPIPEWTSTSTSLGQVSPDDFSDAPLVTTCRQDFRHFVDDGRLVPPASKGLEHGPSYSTPPWTSTPTSLGQVSSDDSSEAPRWQCLHHSCLITTCRQEFRHFVDDGRLVPPASETLLQHNHPDTTMGRSTPGTLDLSILTQFFTSYCTFCFTLHIHVFPDRFSPFVHILPRVFAGTRHR